MKNPFKEFFENKYCNMLIVYGDGSHLISQSISCLINDGVSPSRIMLIDIREETPEDEIYLLMRSALETVDYLFVNEITNCTGNIKFLKALISKDKKIVVSGRDYIGFLTLNLYCEADVFRIKGTPTEEELISNIFNSFERFDVNCYFELNELYYTDKNRLRDLIHRVLNHDGVSDFSQRQIEEADRIIKFIRGDANDEIKEKCI